MCSSSEVAEPFLIVDGDDQYEAAGIFEDSYQEIDAENKVPVPSRYAALKVFEADMPVQIRTSMQIQVRGKLYALSTIREPGKDGITVLELRG